MTALAVALAFTAAVAGVLAWRWMSLNYVEPPDIALDPGRVQEAISDIDKRVGEHESKLNALMLERGLRTSRETRA